MSGSGEGVAKYKFRRFYGTSMARMYRAVEANVLNTGGAGNDFFRIASFDADQAPSGWLEKVKVSVIPVTPQTNNPASFMVVASTNTDATDRNDWITGQATGDGGGTVWLSLKRPIRDSTGDSSRNDAIVYIHIMTQGTGLSTLAVCEAWGRYISVAPHV